MEVNAEKSLDFGIDWQAFGKGNADGKEYVFGGGFTNEGDLLGSNPSVLSKSGLTVGLLSEPVTIAGVTVSNVAAIVNAIKTDDDFRILSTPQIMTTDNEEARITVGENRPYQTRATTDTSGGTFESFEYRDVGKILKITPHVTEGRLVRLKISLEVTNVDETSTATTSSTLPVTQKRTIDTTVIVRDNHTVAIGGLIDDTMTDNQSKVPALGDIPVFGWLFRNTKTTAEKTNLYIFLTPKVIKNPAEADRVYQEKQNEIETIPGGGIRLYRGDEKQ
jgi:general secretion pathway protein D